MLKELTDPLTIEIIIKLGLAIIFGGIIGYERQQSQKAAGFRTITLICMGATLYTIVGKTVAHPDALGRVIGQIVTGIGFLGAGTIMKLNAENTRHSIGGLTTAATIWFVAGVGVCIGLSLYLHALIGTVYAFLILEFSKYKHRINKIIKKKL